MDLKKMRCELDRRRVAVWNADHQTWAPIPVALTPTIVSKSEWQAVVSDARRIFAAFPKVLRWLQSSDQVALKEIALSGLSKLEQRVANLDPATQWGHVT